MRHPFVVHTHMKEEDHRVKLSDIALSTAGHIVSPYVLCVLLAERGLHVNTEHFVPSHPTNVTVTFLARGLSSILLSSEHS